MILKLFTKPDCPRCPAAKDVVAKLEKDKTAVVVEHYDAETVDGMAEAAFYTVMATPTILLCDDKGKEIASWRGQAPDLEELKRKITS
jgi:thioredoxin-related protein